VDRWNELIPLLTAQYGLICRAQLRERSVSRHVVERWVAQRRLERCAPRVWRLAGAPVTWEQRLMVGLLSLGPDATVSHRAAAKLHRLDRATTDVVEFLVPRGQRHGRIDETVHSSKLIRPWDVVVVRGLRVTSATRTVLDLANVGEHPERVMAAIDSAIRMQLSSPEVIRSRLYDIRRRGRGGVRLIDSLLDDAGGHTMLERAFLRAMRDAGLPRPETQVVFRDGNRTVARVDFLYRSWGIVVEVSGQLGHTTPTERARDAQRRNELQDLGFTVYEFTWEQVTRRTGWVQRQMRARLTTAGWPADPVLVTESP
jgi:very-short-patch-repair endonuclease